MILLFTLKLILEDYIKKNADVDYESIKYNFVKRYQFDNNYRVEFLDEIQQIFDEIKKKNIEIIKVLFYSIV